MYLVRGGLYKEESYDLVSFIYHVIMSYCCDTAISFSVNALCGFCHMALNFVASVNSRIILLLVYSKCVY